MVSRLRIFAVVALTVLALAAAGCSSGKSAQNQDSGSGAMSGMEKEGNMASPGSEKGNMEMGKDGGMEGMKMGHGEHEYTPPTPEQLAKVTKTVEITLTDQFKIEPADVAVKKGEVVKFVVRNAGQLPHDWMAEGIEEVDTGEFPGGEERVVVWEADRTGTFTTYCSVPGHREAGMKGTLTVTG